MAVRPVYITTEDESLIKIESIEFEFYSGFSDAQKKKSIRSLHAKFLEKYEDKKVLEISSKSEDELGIRLSAFNLMITTKNGKRFSVESAFQASKVFEHGGPYRDLLDKPSIAAKRDERLRNSGNIIGFQLYDRHFETEPKTFFYNWLYINTLNMHDDLKEQILEYDAFTDIAFNPKKSLNCQAEAAAIYVSLVRQGLIEEALSNETAFREIVYKCR